MGGHRNDDAGNVEDDRVHRTILVNLSDQMTERNLNTIDGAQVISEARITEARELADEMDKCAIETMRRCSPKFFVPRLALRDGAYALRCLADELDRLRAELRK